MTVIHFVLISYDFFKKEHLLFKHMTHTRKINRTDHLHNNNLYTYVSTQFQCILLHKHEIMYNNCCAPKRIA